MVCVRKHCIFSIIMCFNLWLIISFEYIIHGYFLDLKKNITIKNMKIKILSCQHPRRQRPRFKLSYAFPKLQKAVKTKSFLFSYQMVTVILSGYKCIHTQIDIIHFPPVFYQDKKKGQGLSEMGGGRQNCISCNSRLRC